MHIMLRYYDYYRYANAITLDAALVDVLHVCSAAADDDDDVI